MRTILALDSFTFDGNTGRMTKYAFTIGSTPQTESGTLNWNPNGSLNKLTLSDPFAPAGFQSYDCNYGYDDMARLASGNCGSTIWTQTFSYDPFGNITKAVPTGGTGIAWNPGYNSNNRYTLRKPLTEPMRSHRKRGWGRREAA